MRLFHDGVTKSLRERTDEQTALRHSLVKSGRGGGGERHRGGGFVAEDLGAAWWAERGGARMNHNQGDSVGVEDEKQKALGRAERG